MVNTLADVVDISDPRAAAIARGFKAQSDKFWNSRGSIADDEGGYSYDGDLSDLPPEMRAKMTGQEEVEAPRQAPRSEENTEREFRISRRRRTARVIIESADINAEDEEFVLVMMPLTMATLDEFWYYQDQVSNKQAALNRIDRAMDPKGWARARKRAEDAKFTLLTFAFPSLPAETWKYVWENLHPAQYLELLDMVSSEGKRALGKDTAGEDGEDPNS